MGQIPCGVAAACRFLAPAAAACRPGAAGNIKTAAGAFNVFNRSTFKRTELSLVRYQLSKIKELAESDDVKNECRFYSHFISGYRYALYKKDDDESDDGIIASNI